MTDALDAGLLARPDPGKAGPLNAAGFALGLDRVPPEALRDRVPAADLSTLRARRTRIFQIGFNKCGTRSLYRFLQRAGINATHFNRGLLAQAIHANLAAGRHPLAGRIDAHIAYTDMQHITRTEAIEAVRYFRELYAYYPGSYFILNTRDKAGWINSRLAHGAGAYASRYGRALGLRDTDAVVARWSDDWDRHHAEVLAFFADKPGRLLVYDIKTDSPQKIVDFLAPDFLTRADDFRHEGDTAHVDPGRYRGNRALGWDDAAVMGLAPPKTRKGPKKTSAPATSAAKRPAKGR